MAQQYSKKRETVYGTLEAWTDWWRDILLAKTGCDSDIINIDYRSNLSEMAGNLGLADIKETLQSFGDAMKQLKMNVNPRLVLESLMLNMARPGREKAGTLRAGVRNA
jgi:DNA polymerase III gamma/tau subunit